MDKTMQICIYIYIMYMWTCGQIDKSSTCRGIARTLTHMTHVFSGCASISKGKDQFIPLIYYLNHKETKLGRSSWFGYVLIYVNLFCVNMY